MTRGNRVVQHLLVFAAVNALAISASHLVYRGGDTSGCGKPHVGQLVGIPIHRTVRSSNSLRSYSAHLPQKYNEDDEFPVIVGFHMSSSIGLFFELDTRLDEARFTGDKIMIYPNGVGGAWAGANYSQATVEQDLQFVWDMLADVRQNFCVDSARVFATGFSIGAGFVDTLACNATVGGEFAAFAPASGSFYTNNNANHGNCRPARVPTPMLEFHGGADADVKYEGGQGQGGDEPAVTEWLRRWAERNRCEDTFEQDDLFNNEVHHLSWTCHGLRGVVQHYKSDGQKHDWPSTEINLSQLAAGDGPAHIEASAIIQDFFAKFTRPS